MNSGDFDSVCRRLRIADEDWGSAASADPVASLMARRLITAQVLAAASELRAGRRRPRGSAPVRFLATCRWCLRHDCKASDWEQRALKDDTWHPLCESCANKRLRNPCNALLPMRKIDSRDPEEPQS